MTLKCLLITLCVGLLPASASEAAQLNPYIHYNSFVYLPNKTTLNQLLTACASETTYTEYSLACDAILRSSVKLEQPITVFLPTNESLKLAFGPNPIGNVEAFAQAHIAKGWPKPLPMLPPTHYKLFKYDSSTLNGADVHIEYLKPERSSVVYPNYMVTYELSYDRVPVNFEAPEDGNYMLIGNLDHMYGYGVVYAGSIAATTLPTWTGAMCCTRLMEGYLYLLDQPLPF